MSEVSSPATVAPVKLKDSDCGYSFVEFPEDVIFMERVSSNSSFRPHVGFVPVQRVINGTEETHLYEVETTTMPGTKPPPGETSPRNNSPTDNADNSNETENNTANQDNTQDGWVLLRPKTRTANPYAFSLTRNEPAPAHLVYAPRIQTG